LVGYVHEVLPFRRMRIVSARKTEAGWQYNGTYSEAGVREGPEAGPVTNPVILHVLESLEPFIRADMSGGASNHGYEAGMAASGVLSTMVIPLVSKSIAVGVLTLSSAERGAFTAETVALIEPVAALIGAELDRANIFRELERFAVTDPLTGVANRRRFDTVLEMELEAAAQRGTSVGVILIDLDYFKTVNDVLGHLAGDQLLVTVAHILAGTLRTTDLLARFGGDEFVVLLPGADRLAIESVAAKMQQAVHDMPFVARNREFQVSLSMGGALYPDQGADATSLLHAADVALYAAKTKGRARLEVAANSA
jgi:diguanylate cyclase (GGDEF)-like protein